MKIRLKILYRALVEKNVILIYSKRVKDIEAIVITDTDFTVEEDKTILLSAASKIIPIKLKPKTI